MSIQMWSGTVVAYSQPIFMQLEKSGRTEQAVLLATLPQPRRTQRIMGLQPSARLKVA